MASRTLQSLFRESTNRATDRDTFVQVLSKLSGCKEPRKDDGAERLREKVAAEKAA